MSHNKADDGKTKKVNILIGTWYKNGLNYGQVLQAFALQEYIFLQSDINVTYCSEIMRVENKIAERRSYLINAFLLPIKEIFKFRKGNVLKRIKFMWYMKKYILVTNSMFSVKDIASYINEKKVKLLLTGSDQIWNPEGNLSEFYFWPIEGDLVKASYATGLMRAELYFTEKKYQDKLKKYQRWIKEFSFLSVREKDSISILTEMTSTKVNVVLDPTFLLPVKCWVDQINGRRKTDQKYIILYILGDERKIINIVSKLVENYIGLKVFIIEAEDKIKDNRFTIIKNAGPAEFLSWIYYAEYVITNSFHGVAFSLIFRKNFYAFPAIRKGFDSNMSRVIDLLSSLDIIDRYNNTNIEKLEKIDYIEIEKKLDRMIEESKNYLYTILNNVR